MSSPSPNRLAAVLVFTGVALSGLTLAACNQSAPSPPQANPDVTAASSLFPGGGSPPPLDPRAAQYEGNPQVIADGKRLFETYNCVGCHFHGGGGIGPPLMDDQWIYGGRIDQIVASIAQGRPNGMPSWAGKLADDQIWRIAAYVQSLSAPSAAEGGGGASTAQPAAPVGSPAAPTPQTVAAGDLKPVEAASQ